MKLIVNEVLPRSLRRALEKDAREKNVTLNDVAGVILAEHFGIEWQYSGSPYQRTADRFKLKVPEELHRLLRGEAAHKLGTLRGVTLAILDAHFGTPVKGTGRRPRGGKQ